jgi:D-glycero-D-manno-heptose 1,7-bisphosphate phosphatase
MPGRPAVFIDRDGTLIQERSYLADPAGVELIPGTVKALKEFGRVNLPVVIVTNQSGIARGLYSLEDYQRVAERLLAVLEAEGVAPAGVEHCPHHPDFSGFCDCRKPGAGMHRRAAAHLDLDLTRSFYIGDKRADVDVAAEFGGTGVLVRTGYGRDHAVGIKEGVHVVDDLHAAAQLIARLIEAPTEAPSEAPTSVDPKIDLE